MSYTKAKTRANNDINITVLRLGHRLVRDTRASTHVALVARAFGAKEIIMSGAAEDDTADSLKRVEERWGGDVQIRLEPNWKTVLRNWQGIIVHLTMYGVPIDRALPDIKRQLKHSDGGKLLLVIGSEKVPREIYSLATYNVAIANQPHSEIAALAVFLDRIYKGKELYSTFANAKIRIKPSLRGKEVETLV